jgi:hypothetical protein
VSDVQAPRLERRRASDFERQLVERARAWVPSWGLADEHDFGRALLKIAARFSSEVAERLDKSGDKMRRGFFDWLGVQGDAARPARMRVFFMMAVNAVDSVLATAPVRMLVVVGTATVVFESETDVRVVPGALAMVVATDADSDALFLPPPGLTEIEPVPPAAEEWSLKRFAAAGATTLQLDPPSGFAADMILEAGGQQYRIVRVEQDIATIERALGAGLPAQTTVRKVASFAPFDGVAHNQQEHALYLGHPDLLDIDAAATLEIVGAKQLSEAIVWQYWGKRDPDGPVKWQTLDLAPASEQQPDAVVLKKPKGAVESKEIVPGNSSRWIRAFATTVDGGRSLLQVDQLGIRVNCKRQPVPCPPTGATTSPEAEAMANTTPLVLNGVFFLGKEPRQFDAFYLGSAEALSKKGAKVQLCFEMADLTFTALAAFREGPFAHRVLAGVAQDRALHLLEFVSPSGPSASSPTATPAAAVARLQRPGGVVEEVALDQRPPWRVPVWTEGDDFLVATSAGADIWVWHEKKLDPPNSGWIAFGQLPVTATTPVDGLVYLAGTPPKIAALRGGQLFLRDWPNGAQWDAVPTRQGTTPIRLKSIVPVFDTSGGTLATSVAKGMVGVSDANKLFSVTTTGACTPRLAAFTFDIDVRPVAFDDGTTLTLAAVDDSSPPRAPGLRSDPGTNQEILATDVVGPLEGALSGGRLQVLATLDDGRLLTWAPFPVGTSATALESEIPSSVGQVGGGPTMLDGHVVVPGARADVFVADFDLALDAWRAPRSRQGSSCQIRSRRSPSTTWSSARSRATRSPTGSCKPA